jgi:hypothetical protein
LLLTQLASVATLAGALACSTPARRPSVSDDRVGQPDAAALLPTDEEARTCPGPDAGNASSFDPNRRRGPALVVGEFDGFRVPVWDEQGDTGIDGAAILVQSQLGTGLGGPITAPAVLSASRGRLCLAGNTVIVPLMNLRDYWGVEIELFFYSPSRNLPTDAGAPTSLSLFWPLAAPFEPWDPVLHNVIGFSFVVEGNDPSLPCAGVPPIVHVEGVPTGSDLDQDIFCRQYRGLASGVAEDALFSELTRDCWNPGGPAILAEPRPAGFTGELSNLQFVVPADEMEAHHFDLCIGDIRPIYGD